MFNAEEDWDSEIDGTSCVVSQQTFHNSYYDRPKKDGCWDVRLPRGVDTSAGSDASANSRYGPKKRNDQSGFVEGCNWRDTRPNTSTRFGRGSKQANADNGTNNYGNRSRYQPEPNHIPDERSKRDSGTKEDSGNRNDNSQGRNRRNGTNGKVINVDNQMVGKIIGRQGAKIRQLQEDSGARIQVTRDSDNYSTPVEISGSQEAIEKATKMIDEILNPPSNLVYPEDENYEMIGKSKARPQINWQQAWDDADKAMADKWKNHAPIVKDVYIETEEVAMMTSEQADAFRLENNNITVMDLLDEGSREVPNPIRTFEEAFGEYDEVMGEIAKQKFTKPSPIQCQGWPIALKGYDLIGIAQTGSGKTIAFLLPALIHIEAQPTPREKRVGPSVLVLSPTRELALQIHSEVVKYHYKGIKSVCIYGGGNRRDQINLVSKGVEIVIATPGRLNDLIMNGIIKVQSVTFLVLDEADRMLDLGFEPQIMKILLDVRPDRQTIMTSATWPEGVRRLSRNYMKDPMQVYIGTLDLAACHSVTQLIEVLEEDEKRSRLLDFFQFMQEDEKVLVFVGRRTTADHLSSDLSLQGIEVQCIHGGREQEDREQALEDFKSGIVKILIATDVASRGIDIKDITYVLNFDCPNHIEEYVHRVGRTGRAGKTGTSLTLMTRKDWRWAGDIIKIMQEADQEIPDELVDMAERWKRHKKKLDEEKEALGGFGGRGGGRPHRGRYPKGW